MEDYIQKATEYLPIKSVSNAKHFMKNIEAAYSNLQQQDSYTDKDIIELTQRLTDYELAFAKRFVDSGQGAALLFVELEIANRESQKFEKINKKARNAGLIGALLGSISSIAAAFLTAYFSGILE